MLPILAQSSNLPQPNPDHLLQWILCTYALIGPIVWIWVQLRKKPKTEIEQPITVKRLEEYVTQAAFSEMRRAHSEEMRCVHIGLTNLRKEFAEDAAKRETDRMTEMQRLHDRISKLKDQVVEMTSDAKALGEQRDAAINARIDKLAEQMGKQFSQVVTLLQQRGS